MLEEQLHLVLKTESKPLSWLSTPRRIPAQAGFRADHSSFPILFGAYCFIGPPEKALARVIWGGMLTQLQDDAVTGAVNWDPEELGYLPLPCCMTLAGHIPSPCPVPPFSV